MTLTVLFDLDDTLLHTNTKVFLPAYFKGLSKALSHIAAQDKITDRIRVAVGKMVANQNPSKYLREVFAENFYPLLGTTESECQQALDRFYANEFPKLRSLVTQKGEASSLIQWCRSQEMILAVTTNPLFPETATRQRIEWAGLLPQDFSFFSTFDNFHFTKPNLRYYAEAIGRLGWPEGPIVMVGDNLTHDLIPAEQIGLETFWINPPVEEPTRPHGSLKDLKDFLFCLQQSSTQINIEDDPKVLLAILRSTPAVIEAWLDTFNADALHRAPAPDEWSANEVIWHLADFEEHIYQPQWKQILRNPDQTVPHIETSHWAGAHHYADRDPAEACQHFLHGRLASLEMIEALLEKGLFKIAVNHTVFSKTTISELISFTAKHDRLHLRQCAQALKF
jgi:FMN phosphatase YigB (HAD superfamily)